MSWNSGGRYHKQQSQNIGLEELGKGTGHENSDLQGRGRYSIETGDGDDCVFIIGSERIPERNSIKAEKAEHKLDNSLEGDAGGILPQLVYGYKRLRVQKRGAAASREP